MRGKELLMFLACVNLTALREHMYFTIGARLHTLKSDLGTISWLGEVEIFSYNAVCV